MKIGRLNFQETMDGMRVTAASFLANIPDPDARDKLTRAFSDWVFAVTELLNTRGADAPPPEVIQQMMRNELAQMVHQLMPLIEAAQEKAEWPDQVEELRSIEGMPHIKIVDNDHLSTMVDGEEMVFSRSDRYNHMPGSGLAHFGPATGDWRPIERIADDIRAAFEQLDKEV